VRYANVFYKALDWRNGGANSHAARLKSQCKTVKTSVVFTRLDSSSVNFAEDLELGALCEAGLVVERARKLAWKIDVIVDDLFQVDLGQLRVGKQYH
jgi:hypothetical protein